MSDSMAWLAGILEGEGHFQVLHRDGRVQIGIHLAMSDLDVVERSGAAFPGATRPQKKGTIDRHHRKQMYVVHWHGRAAVDLMWGVLPYMGARRTDKILTCLADWLESKLKACTVCETEFQIGPSAKIQVCSPECARVRKNLNQNLARSREVSHV